MEMKARENCQCYEELKCLPLALVHIITGHFHHLQPRDSSKRPSTHGFSIQP